MSVDQAVRRRKLWRGLPVLTPRFVVVLAALSLAAALLPFESFWVVIAVLNAVACVVAAVDWLLAPRPDDIKVERLFPRSTTMDEPAEIQWAIANPNGRAQVVAIADQLPPSFKAKTRRLRVRVPGNGRVVAFAEFRPQRRGRFHIAEMVVRTQGPLGLWSRQSTRQVPETLDVLVRFRSRREVEARINRALVTESGLRSARARGTGTEFEQLREYSVDDDHRRLDWFATARANKPIVRTYRAEQNQSVYVALDCGRLMAGRIGDAPRLERALDATLAVSTIASRMGDRVGMISFDDDLRSEVALGRGNKHLGDIRNSIFRLQPRLVESNYRRALLRLNASNSRRSLVFLLTDISDSALGEALVPTLALLSRRHLVVVAAMADPDVSTWSRAEPTEVDKAFRKAAAIEALASRRKAAARLATTGAMVVDVPADKLVAKLGDVYFEAKASGRL